MMIKNSEKKIAWNQMIFLYFTQLFNRIRFSVKKEFIFFQKLK